MKILFYNHTGQVSGAERVLMMILKGLDRDQYQPVVICPRASRMMELASSAQVETRALDQLEARFTWRIDRLAKYLLSFARVIARGRSLVKTEKPAFVHANSIRAGLVMSAATIGMDVPVIWHAHDILPLHPLSTLVRLFALSSSRNHILAVSHAVAKGFRGLLLRPFKRRIPITVIHNSVDPDRFQPDATLRGQVRAGLGLANVQPVVGSVGQLTKRKGQLELIRAFASVVRKVPTAMLLIVGEVVFSHDEEYAQSLRDTVAALGLTDQVKFLGPRSDVPGLLQAFDVLVVNSHQEPFALTVLEGLASGIAVLATAVGGTPEMVQHQANGWLVESGDGEQLSTGIVTLLNNSVLRAELGAAARQDAVARYSPARFLAELSCLYRLITGERKISQEKNLAALEVNAIPD